MSYTVECEATVAGDLPDVWATWSDMAAYPHWDPREEEMHFHGPLVAGATGWSKQKGGRAGSDFIVVLVEPGHRWTNQTPLPGGKLIIDHTLTETAPGQVRVVKTYTAHGPISPLFRLYYARGIRKENPDTFAALAHEVRRRHG